jgi:hypothetical protein
MQKLSVRKLSLLGLVLMAASAVTAAILPKETPKTFDGVLQGSTGAVNQKTCVDVSGVKNCTFTADSGTTGGVGSSDATDTGGGGTLNSSKSPN